jgi:hypothetical protein
MDGKFEAYTDVMARLVGETVRCSPSSWNRGMLAIQCDGVRLDYQLKSDDNADRAVIGDALRGLIEELYVRMRNAGDMWREAHVHWWREDGATKYKIDFTYDEAAPKAPPVAGDIAGNPVGKRWWRRWGLMGSRSR